MAEVQLFIGPGNVIQAGGSISGRAAKSIGSDSDAETFEEVLSNAINGQEGTCSQTGSSNVTEKVKQPEGDRSYEEPSDKESPEEEEPLTELSADIIAQQAVLAAFSPALPVMAKSECMDRVFIDSGDMSELQLTDKRAAGYEYLSDQIAADMPVYQRQDSNEEWVPDAGLEIPVSGADDMSAALQANQDYSVSLHDNEKEMLNVNDDNFLQTDKEVIEDDAKAPALPEKEQEYNFSPAEIPDTVKPASKASDEKEASAIEDKAADLLITPMLQGQDDTIVNAEFSEDLQGVQNSSEPYPVMEQLIDSLDFTELSGKKELVVRLRPDSLGSVCIQLTEENGATDARIIADLRETSEMIQSQISILKQQFTEQGLTIGRLEVVCDNSGFLNGGFSGRGSEDTNSSAYVFYGTRQNEEAADQADLVPDYLMPYGMHINYLI